MIKKLFNYFSIRSKMNLNKSNTVDMSYLELYNKENFHIFYNYYKSDNNIVKEIINSKEIEINFNNMASIYNYYKITNDLPIKDLIESKFLNFNNSEDASKKVILSEIYYNYNELNKINFNNEGDCIDSKLINAFLNRNIDKLIISNEDVKKNIINCIKLNLLTNVNNDLIIKELNTYTFENFEIYDLNIIMNYINKYKDLFMNYTNLENRLVYLVNSLDFDIDNLEIILNNTINNKNNYSSEVYNNYNKIINNNIQNINKDTLLKICYNLQTIYRLNEFTFEKLLKYKFKNDNQNLLLTDIIRRRLEANITLGKDLEILKNNFINQYNIISSDKFLESQETIKILFLLNKYFYNIFKNSEEICFNFDIVDEDNILNFVNSLNNIWDNLDDENNIKYFKLYFKYFIENIEKKNYYNNIWVEQVWNKIVF